MPGWDLADRMALRALEWTWSRRDSFRLPDDVTDPAVSVDATLKPLGELAQTAAFVRRSSAAGSPRRRLADDCLRFAWDQLRHGQVLFDLLRSEPVAAYPLEVYAPFPGAGLRHRPLEEFGAFLAGTRAWQVAEHVPTRVLGVRSVLRDLAIGPEPDPAEVVGRTWLGGRPEPWAMDVHAGYALTHDVFHLTDWGRRPEGLPAHLADYLGVWLPAWVETWLEERHWDLTGELLAVDALLPRPTAGQETWERYAAAQAADGSVPAVGDRLGPGLTPPEVFAVCHHATLVAAFAAALVDARPRHAAA
ncbi:DUF6895 family protein [Actinosynnema sp. CS-041913]|uniref:DUF6895 family protein n=1 Tax=Actinosynnema sp. CS-041913 TaxID=3239917 RepID=UPI003D914DF7